LSASDSKHAPLLRCRDLQVGYARKAILPALNIDIAPGEFLAVLGANGAGKSTWFRTVLGLLAPISGSVERASRTTRLSYVPQRASLDPLLPMTAKRVVRWGRLRGWSFLQPLRSLSDREHVQQSMKAAHSEEFAASTFADLSGGQQQRVLFAQLLASEAELVFLDEPTASMDLASERDTYERLATLCKDKGVAVVVITHSITSARTYADRFLFLDKGSEGSEGVAVAGSAAQIGVLPEFKRQFGSVFLTPDNESADGQGATGAVA